MRKGNYEVAYFTFFKKNLFFQNYFSQIIFHKIISLKIFAYFKYFCSKRWNLIATIRQKDFFFEISVF